MKKITKLLLTVALCALTIIAAGCGGDNKAADKKADPNAPVKIGVTAGPHAEIMDNVKKLAEKQGDRLGLPGRIPFRQAPRRASDLRAARRRAV